MHDCAVCSFFRRLFSGRSGWTIATVAALSLIAVAIALAQESTEKKELKTGEQPRVSIEPRVKKPAAGDEDKYVPGRATIRIDTTLVLIPVNVTDQLNRFVKDLDKEHFK